MMALGFATFGWLTLGAAPEAASIYPAGGRVGKAIVVVVRGKDLDDAVELYAPDVGSAERIAADSSTNGSTRRFGLKITTTVPGTYPLWLRSNRGISAPLLFAVGTAAERLESDAGSEQELAPIPCVLNGKLGGAEIDRFRFRGRFGQRVGVDVLVDRIGGGFDPRVTIRDAGDRVIAERDDTPGLGCDCRFIAVLPKEGEYTLEIHDSTFSAPEDQPYRIRLGCAFATEVFPLGGRAGKDTTFTFEGGTLAAPTTTTRRLTALPGVRLAIPFAGNGIERILVDRLPEIVETERSANDEAPIRTPCVINGRIGRPEETDRYRIAVRPEQSLILEVAAQRLRSRLDPLLTVTTDGGERLLREDDVFVQSATNRRKDKIGYFLVDPKARLTVPKGVEQLIVSVTDRAGRGGIGYGYRLRIEATERFLELRAERSAASAPQGGVGRVKIAVDRRGYAGAIELTADGLPKDWSTRPQVIAAGLETGYFLIEAAPDAPVPMERLRIVGRASDGSTDRIPVIAEVIPAGAAASRLDVPPPKFTTGRLAVALTEALPLAVRIDATESSTLARGVRVHLSIALELDPTVVDAQSTLALSALGLPKGIEAEFEQPSVTEPRGSISLTAGEAAEAGPLALIVEATLKIDKRVIVATSSALTLAVRNEGAAK